MKTLFTIPMLIAIIISGIISLHLFEREQYAVSALFTAGSYLSMILLVTVLKSKKIILQ